jgi:hypothetical protein
MAICKTCGAKYSKWTAPVSAGGLCPECFESVLSEEREVKPEEPVALSAIAKTEKRNIRIRLTSFIPRSRSKAVFALAMSCYCVTLSYFIAAWARALHIPPPPPSFYLSGGIGDVVALLAFAPITESLILVSVFELVRRAHAPTAVQVIAAAFFISEAHVWPWWPHAVIVLPSFCIQSASYLYWRRTSWKTAFWVVASIHALNNSISAVSAIGRAIQHVHPHM